MKMLTQKDDLASSVGSLKFLAFVETLPQNCLSLGG